MERSTLVQKSIFSYFPVTKIDYSQDRNQLQGKQLKQTTKENVKSGPKPRGKAQEIRSLGKVRTKTKSASNAMITKIDASNKTTYYATEIGNTQTDVLSRFNDSHVHRPITKTLNLSADELESLITKEKNLVIENDMLTVIIDDSDEEVVFLDKEQLLISSSKQQKVSANSPKISQLVDNKVLDGDVSKKSNIGINAYSQKQGTNLDLSKSQLDTPLHSTTKRQIKEEVFKGNILTGEEESVLDNSSSTSKKHAKRVLFPEANAINGVNDCLESHELSKAEEIKNCMTTILSKYTKLTNVPSSPAKVVDRATAAINNLIEISKNVNKTLEELAAGEDIISTAGTLASPSPAKKFKYLPRRNYEDSSNVAISSKEEVNSLKLIKDEESNKLVETPLKTENCDKLYPCDANTLDLNSYGLDEEELENYSPSFWEKLELNDQNNTLLDKSLDKSSTPSTSKHCEINVRNMCDLQASQRNLVREEVLSDTDEDLDLDATIICDESENNLPSSEEAATKTVSLNVNQTQITSKLIQSHNALANDTKQLDNQEEQPSYVRNMFNIIWKEVNQSPHLVSLISPDDSQNLNRLFVLPNEYQEVVMRLFTRLPKWHQAKKFTEEIHLTMSMHELVDMMDTLEALQFIYQDYKNMETLETLLKLLSNQDIKQILKALKMKLSSSKKNDMIKGILDYASCQKTLSSKDMTSIITDKVVLKLGSCIKLNSNLRMSLFRLQLLYFFPLPDITTHSELYLFISGLENGDVTLPEFTVTSMNIFKDYSLFNSYADAMKLYFEYLSTKEKKLKMKNDKLEDLANIAYNELCKIQVMISDYHGSKFTPGHLYTKILSLATIDLTKNNDLVQKWLWQLLQNKYCISKRGGWYAQLAMHLEKYDKKLPEALEVIRAGLADTDVSLIDKYSLSARANALTKRQTNKDNVLVNLVIVPNMSEITHSIIDARPWEIRRKLGTRMLYVENSVLYTVEEIARAHYNRKGFPKGVHCEGALLMTLFAALFWDIIYSNVDAVFISKLQSVPLDLYSREFYERRKAKIDKRLLDISSGWNDDYLFEKLLEWKRQHAHEKSIHSRHLFDNSSILEQSVVCLTRAKLAKMLERLVQDVGQFQAGMPDLFLWNVEEKKCLFAEVKSQHDVLSMKQKAWLQFLQKIGVDVEICYVNSIGEKASKARTMLF